MTITGFKKQTISSQTGISYDLYTTEPSSVLRAQVSETRLIEPCLRRYVNEIYSQPVRLQVGGEAVPIV